MPNSNNGVNFDRALVYGTEGEVVLKERLPVNGTGKRVKNARNITNKIVRNTICPIPPVTIQLRQQPSHPFNRRLSELEILSVLDQFSIYHFCDRID